MPMFALCAAILAGDDPAALVDVSAPGSVGIPLLLPADVDGLRSISGAEAGAMPVLADAALGECATYVIPGLTGRQVVWFPVAQGERTYALYFRGQPPPSTFPTLSIERSAGEVRVSNGAFTVTHSLTRNAGAPERIVFADGGAPDDLQMWGDRIGNETMFLARNDPSPEVEVIEHGPRACTVRARARFCDDAGRPAGPEVTYAYTYFACSPFVRIEARVTQPEARAWQELNLFQRVYKQLRYPSWIVAPPSLRGDLTGANESHLGTALAGMFDAEHAVGLMGLPCRIYDEDLELPGGWGSYIHGPWVGMDSREYACSGWLYIGPSGDRGSAMLAAAEALAAQRFTVRTPRFDREIAAAEERASNLRGRHRLIVRAAAARARRVSSDLSAVAQAREAVTRLDELVSRQGVHLDDPDAEQVLGNDRLCIALGPASAGFPVRGIQAADSGFDFGPGDGGGLWRLRFRDAAGQIAEVDSAAPCDHSCNADDEGHRLRLRWSGLTIGDETRAADVEVAGRIETGSVRTYWTIRVRTHSRQWALWEVDFPHLTGLRVDPRDGAVAYPRFVGYLENHPLVNESPDLIYPSHAATMQIACVQSNGSALYLGNDDGAAWYKRYKFRPEAGQSLCYTATHYPPYTPGQPGEFELPYNAVLGVFAGDWIDACALYREWALQQEWCRRGPLSSRKDIPAWLTDLGAWFVGAPSDKAVERAAAIGAPVAIQRYGWHEIPFDDNYPDYFPPKAGFVEEVQRMHEGGIRVVPYINGRLWDTDTESFAVEGAQSWCTKDAGQQRYIENWGQQNHSVMCPSTDFWQAKVAGIVTRMARELDVDGVYIDQVASYYPMRCFDPGHPHPAGSGDAWVPGYRRLVERCQEEGRGAKPGLILTTEDHAEPFLDLFDACLTCNAAYAASGLIPMFHHVYSGYTILYGRYSTTPDTDANALAFRQKNAQMLVWGTQIGWLDDGCLGHREEETAYFGAMARAFVAARPFVLYGQMLRPMHVVESLPELSAEWNGGQVATMPAVLHSAWRSPEGELGLVATNIDTVPHTLTLRAPRDWADDTFAGLDEVFRYGHCTHRLDGRRRVVLDLPARGIVVLKMSR